MIVETTNIPLTSIPKRLLKKELRDFDDISYKKLTSIWQYIYTSFILLISVISLIALYYFPKEVIYYFNLIFFILLTSIYFTWLARNLSIFGCKAPPYNTYSEED